MVSTREPLLICPLRMATDFRLSARLIASLAAALSVDAGALYEATRAWMAGEWAPGASAGAANDAPPPRAD